jgi:hypothetical protein
MFTAAYTSLEAIVPGIDTNPANINPGGPVPTSFTDTPWNGGTTINIGGAQWAAGLSKRFVTPQPDMLAACSRFTFSYQIRPSQLALLLSQANENDLMLTDGKQNLFNGSMRKNNSTGGMWEIVNAAGAWVATGFKPGPFTPDVWTQVIAVYQVNWAALTISVLSITDGAATFALPSPLALPAIKNSGWQASIIDWQAQETLKLPGAFTRDTRNVGVAMQ